MTEPKTYQQQTTEPVESRTYTEAEYASLKDESIKNRKRAAMADNLREALQIAYLEKGTTGVLVDAGDLAWTDEFNDPESGLPDVDRIKEAAEALVADKPHLGRVRGDAGQGVRDQSVQNGDIHGLLRQLI